MALRRMGLRRVCALLMLAAPAAAAQTVSDDSLTYTLPAIEVQATRASETTASAAQSVYVRHRKDIALDPGLSLQRILRGVPGIQINDRGHFALGERLLIRGIGYRAAFGVRGAQVFLDGIPLTIADGQSMLDVVEPAQVARAEVLRGPASLYWGNSSGGVLMMTSVQDTAALRLRGMVGSHGLRHVMGSARRPLGNGYIQTFISSIDRTGWREHSEGGFLRMGLRGRFELGPATNLSLSGAAALQDVQAPGSLTAAQYDANPQAADPRYVDVGAGKESTHLQAGAVLRSDTPLGRVSIAAYGISRALDNPLTFATINLDRLAAGTYGQLHNGPRRMVWTLGWDVRLQHDQRKNEREGDMVLNQEERVRNLAVSGMVRLMLSERLRLMAGMRADALRFAMTDQLLTNGDQSGSRTMTSLSPAWGMAFVAGPMVAYGNVSTAFETPTTTELVNRPGTDGGFNVDLGPQRTRGVELGIRGPVPRLRMEADIALFWMRINDRLLPRQSEDGRTWYANEGQNSHRGLELALAWPLGRPAYVEVAYTAGRYVFLNEPGDGLHIPGVPAHQGQIALHWAARGFAAEIAADFASRMWADSDNTAEIAGHMVLDIYAAHQGIALRRARIQPFMSCSNLFGASYATSLVVNAFGGRFFEPAPGRAIQLGLSMVLP